ncbi:MAG: hypothetical protein JXA57_13550 [Armatimonadetes bacterium]|nr:hypothetical protein [Armatimonadota bacterium]
MYFNFNPPASDLSMYNGSIYGDDMAARMVPSSGEYLVRVYQMGAAADENRKGSFTLTVRVTGTALTPLPASVDATLPGTPYHARGSIPCSIALEQTRTSCDAYVIRYGEGNATVEFRAGKLIRRVLFLKGKPVASDAAETMSSSREGDMTTVRFGEDPSESYRVPEALIYGG